MKLVSVITVNYNQPAVTEDLLHSILEKNTYPHIEVIVVDNKSSSDPVPKWKKKFPSVQFIRSEKNLGFAGGNNLGIAHAKGDYFFLINNDTEITSHLIYDLVKTLETGKHIGMVSPKIRYFHQPGVLQYAGYTEINFVTARNKCIGQLEPDKGQYDHISGKTGYAHGAAMMVKREAIEKSGLMAENFFLYYEELDWCERIKKAGFEIWINTQAIIYHKESVSVGKKSALKEYYMNRNRMLFVRKNASAVTYAAFLMYFLLLVVPKNIIGYVLEKQYRFIPLLFKALWWNFSNSANSNKLYFPATR